MRAGVTLLQRYNAMMSTEHSPSSTEPACLVDDGVMMHWSVYSGCR